MLSSGVHCLAVRFARSDNFRRPCLHAPVWPPPPAEARIVYLRTITRPADVGVKPAALGRIANWITGAARDAGVLVKPFGLALDETGNLLITDTGANAVCCFDRTRKKWLRWESVGKTRFDSPVAIARHGQTFFCGRHRSGQGHCV